MRKHQEIAHQSHLKIMHLIVTFKEYGHALLMYLS